MKTNTLTVEQEFRRPMGTRGQVVIPRDIRRRLGLQPGAAVVFRVGRQGVEMRPDREPSALLAEFLQGPKRPRSPSPAALKRQLESRYDDVLP